MEAGSDHEVHEMISVSGGVGGTTTPATSRWNPTKEQITMLENLYRQGIRTPTAEQIQEITGRLQAYGHIEGKNVFYWFQNHKARQRQKQKQDQNNNFAYNFHRYLHHHPQAVPVPPLFPAPHHPPCPNVVCSPYYMPQPDLGFYPHHQYPKVLLPPTAIKKRSPRADQLDHPRPTTNGYTEGGAYNGYMSHANGYKRNIEDQLVNWKNNHSFDHDHQETLELFPMHPTGILQARSSTTDCQIYSDISTPSSYPETSTTVPPTSSNICMMNNVEEGSAGTTDHQLYFDFLSGH